MCRSSQPQGSYCCESSGARQPTHRYEHHHYAAERLGVRRPLRFMAWKLELDERQVTELASILNELKTERAQADVDDRRALALLAGAAETETFDRDKASEAARLRSQSAERVQQKVVESLARMHALLEPEQRARLAYLLRTGTLMM